MSTSRTSHRRAMSRVSRRSKSAPLALWLIVVIPSIVAAQSATSPDNSSTQNRLRAGDYLRLRSLAEGVDIERLADGISRGRADASECEIGPSKVACSGVVTTVDGMEMEAARWERDDESVRLQDVRIEEVEGERSHVFETLSVEGQEVVLEGVRLRHSGSTLFRANRGTVDGQQVVFEEVAWLDGDGRTSIRAERASFDGSEWSFDRLRRRRPLGVGLGRVSMSASRPASGLLPPRLIASGSRVEVRGSYVHGPTLLGLTAAGAPGYWYGGGGLIQTPAYRDPFPDLSTAASLLNAEIRWHQEENDLGWSVVGDVRRGSPYVHIGASLEEQSHGSFWRTSRVDRPGVLRNWRASHVGGSLSGPRHHLQVSAGHFSPTTIESAPAVRVDELMPGEQLDARLRFGATRPVGRHFEATAGLFHRNFFRDGARDTHSTTAVTDLTGRIGSRNALYGEAGATMLVGANIRTSGQSDDSPRGFDAPGHTQLLAHLRSGITLTGRLGEQTLHRVRPSLSAYREIVGTGELETVANPYASPPGRVPGWTAFSAILHQELAWPRFRFGFPVGLISQGSYPHGIGIGSPRLFGRIQADWSRVYLGGGALYGLKRRRTSLFGNLGLNVGSVAIGWHTTSLRPRELALSGVDELMGSPIQVVRLLEPIAASPLSDEGLDALFHSLSFDWNVAESWIRLGLFSEDTFTRNGFRAGWRYPFDPYGWSLSLDGVFESGTQQWGVSAGLATGR